MAKRYTVAVDFDGVIHRYDTPWIAPHVIPDEPVEGAFEWLYTTLQRFDVVIFSTRAKTWRGRRAIRRWLEEHSSRMAWLSGVDEEGDLLWRGLVEVKVAAKKPPALIYLDDRAVRFTGPGSFPSPEEIHRARPWHKAIP